MSLGILNNIAALYAQNNLDQTQSNLQNTLQQLSSGSRINSGADDAAGLAVANGLGANEAALTQSSANATDGIGLLQTADGALSQVTNLLDRAVTLATEAANGTLTAGQVSSANQEYQNILTQIGNIGATTNFNSSAVFSSTATNFVVTDGTSSGLNTYADTVGALTRASVGTTTPTGTTTAITNPTPTASTTSAGSTATFSLGAAADTISGTLSVAVGSGSAVSVTLTAGTTIAQAVTALNADSGFSGAGLVVSQGTGANANKLIVTGPVDSGTPGTNTLVLTGTSLSQTTPAGTTPGAGVDFTASNVATLTASSASAVLSAVNTAIADVAYQRGSIGADVNELTSASAVASSEEVNLASAQNSIMATDYGQAASNLSKYQILSQTGISALAQANSVQQEVLKLLQ
ncbi:MAG TPA: flagellin [Acidobacteriaceae bacterium]|nr:flagellin [Acidobacteriaceae bacterium]